MAINHPVRFTEADIELKALINSEKMGGLNAIHISAGNFGLAMNVSHTLEMLRFVSGEYPQSVQAWFDSKILPNPRGQQFQDRSGFLKITTKSGKILTVNASSNNGHGIITTYVCPLGQIALNVLTGDAMVTYREEQHREKPTTLYGLPSKNYTDKFNSSDLVVWSQKTLKALIEGHGYPDGQTILRTIEILVAAHVSNENENKIINVEKDKLPESRVFPWA